VFRRLLAGLPFLIVVLRNREGRASVWSSQNSTVAIGELHALPGTHDLRLSAFTPVGHCAGEQNITLTQLTDLPERRQLRRDTFGITRFVTLARVLAVRFGQPTPALVVAQARHVAQPQRARALGDTELGRDLSVRPALGANQTGTPPEVVLGVGTLRLDRRGAVAQGVVERAGTGPKAGLGARRPAAMSFHGTFRCHAAEATAPH
jgi:hypothetical protein